MEMNFLKQQIFDTEWSEADVAHARDFFSKQMQGL